MGSTRKTYRFLALAAVAGSLVFGAAPAGAENAQPRLPAWVEPGVDRPGSDFRILWLRGGLEACQEACAQNPLCKSYTYVREGSPGRMEGCWLKDAVSPPVRDTCCVSGVKTGETVSRYLQEPVALPKPAVSQAPPQSRTVLPGPVGRAPESVEEKEPETGSGERRRAGLDFSAIPPGQVGRKIRNGNHAAVASKPAGVGAGRRGAKGLNFAALPPGRIAVPVSEPPRRERRDTGAGRRGVRGVVYAAAPPAGGMSFAEGSRAGSVIRKIIGVDITAVPPDQKRGESQ